MGYSESSQAYRIYISRSRQIEVSKDVTFEEEMAIRKGGGSDLQIDDDEEMRSSPPPEVKREFEEKNDPIDPIDPVELVDAPIDMAVGWKKAHMGTTNIAGCRGARSPTQNLSGKQKTLEVLELCSIDESHH